MAITVVFFLWPAGQTAWQSVLREDPFGLKSTFVWFDNYSRLFRDPNYLSAFGATGLFAFATAVVSIGVALILALAVDRTIRSAPIYTTLIVWPYAVAPAVAGGRGGGGGGPAGGGRGGRGRRAGGDGD